MSSKERSFRLTWERSQLTALNTELMDKHCHPLILHFII
jgi:hypothetical protein